jgi:hypothetical protein
VFAVNEEVDTIQADCCCKVIEILFSRGRRKPANERKIYHIQGEGSLALRRRGMHTHGEPL